MINPISEQDQVFNRPLHLAGLLDNAADELTHWWSGYEWNDRTRCNCGIVARQVMQVSARKLKKLLPPVYDRGAFHPSWRSMTETYCPDTGLPQNEVFSHLLAAGLWQNDLLHLEDLSHPDILEHMHSYRSEKRAVHRSRKSDVIAYLRAWAAGIESFHDAFAPAPDAQPMHRKLRVS